MLIFSTIFVFWSYNNYNMKKLTQSGFIPMMILMLLIILAVIFFAYMRIHAKQ